MAPYTITKIFKGYPFAHRQPEHEGHCSLIHGHNWDFEVTLEADELDECGFVYDFGKFKEFKEWLTAMFDHTCLINHSDPEASRLLKLRDEGLADIVLVSSCSCEGLAEMVYRELVTRIAESEGTRVRVVSVTVHEDYKNKSTYHGGN